MLTACIRRIDKCARFVGPGSPALVIYGQIRTRVHFIIIVIKCTFFIVCAFPFVHVRRAPSQAVRPFVKWENIIGICLGGVIVSLSPPTQKQWKRENWRGRVAQRTRSENCGRRWNSWRKIRPQTVNRRRILCTPKSRRIPTHNRDYFLNDYQTFVAHW